MNEKYKKYWLNLLSDEENLALENEYFLDSDVFEDVLAAKQQLIHDYCNDRLPSRERRAFEKDFLASSAHREELKFQQAVLPLQESLLGESQGGAKTERTVSFQPGQWFQLFPHFSLRGQFALVSAVLLAVLSVGGLIYWQSVKNALPQGVLLASVASTQPAQVLNLSPVENLDRGAADSATRSVQGESKPTIHLNSENKFLHFQLALPSDTRITTAMVKLVQLDKPSTLGTLDNLSLSASGKFEISVAKALLPEGDYKLQLLPAGATETEKIIAEYVFLVR